jgi:hypothetical protein
MVHRVSAAAAARARRRGDAATSWGLLGGAAVALPYPGVEEPKGTRLRSESVAFGQHLNEIDHIAGCTNCG